jgi:DNA-binding transcriptional MerR regulator
MDNGRTYTAERLAEKANVSLRTVRYYIQEGLIPPPENRGPGAHFTNTHLHQLLRIRTLQDAGLDLKTIKEVGPTLESAAANLLKSPTFSKEIWRIIDARSRLRAMAATREDDAEERAPERIDLRTATRIPMADGVELIVKKGMTMPSPKDLVDIALLVRKKFEGK